MARKKSVQDKTDYSDFDINESLFFGLNLTDEQKEYRDAIYGNDYDIIFCDSKAGTGKTTVAVATAKILVEQGKYDKLIYLVSPSQEFKQGFLPGTIESKTMIYAQPLFDALIEIGEQPERAIMSNDDADKIGFGWVKVVSHTFERGVNYKHSIIVCDEMQNAYVDECRKILTRQCEDSIMICIGNGSQCDLYKNSERSGFNIYLEWFRNKERCKVCSLTKNFRMWTAQYADEITEKDIKNIIDKLKGENNK